MGEKLMAGRGVPQNNSEAMHWFRLTSIQNHELSLSQIQLQQQTLNRAAADQGHAHAQYNLAAAHLNGHDAGLEEVWNKTNNNK